MNSQFSQVSELNKSDFDSEKVSRIAGLRTNQNSTFSKEANFMGETSFQGYSRDYTDTVNRKYSIQTSNNNAL